MTHLMCFSQAVQRQPKRDLQNEGLVHTWVGIFFKNDFFFFFLILLNVSVNKISAVFFPKRKEGVNLSIHQLYILVR